jgi:hypothetical protein
MDQNITSTCQNKNFFGIANKWSNNMTKSTPDLRIERIHNHHIHTKPAPNQLRTHQQLAQVINPEASKTKLQTKLQIWIGFPAIAPKQTNTQNLRATTTLS